ncbi:unnamed protein product [uncultured bacterium]|nr:unnamed protein product [uncultured bacterium]
MRLLTALLAAALLTHAQQNGPAVYKVEFDIRANNDAPARHFSMLVDESRKAVYVIASLTIKDAVRFEDYKRTVLPSMEKYGGRFVARGGPIHVLEGEWPRERLIIGEFPSMERAREWWASPEYAEPKALRQATTDSELVIVQGV